MKSNRSEDATKSKAYNIILLPEADITAKAIKTSTELGVLGTNFTLGTDTCIPHVSLYMVQLDPSDLPKVLQLLSDIAAHTPTPSLEATKYYQENGYIDTEYQKTDVVSRLQMEVVGAINPIRAGLREQDKPRLQSATGLVRQNLQQYGYRAIGELFRPHLTLTRFKSHTPISIEDLLTPTIFSGKYPKLAICQMGRNGTCIQKIAEFNLQ